MFITKNLAHKFGANTEISYPDIHIEQGEQSLILGESGSGKTTLLHIIAGLRKPTKGDVILNNQNIYQLSSAQLDKLRGRQIGIVFQHSHFVASLSVQENLLLAQQLAGNKQEKSRVKELLNRLNIGHKINSKTATLSAGEQQRVAIARALINRPTVILADEPTSALDDKNTEQVIQLLMEQSLEAKATLIVVTHDNRLGDNFNQKIEL